MVARMIYLCSGFRFQIFVIRCVMVSQDSDIECHNVKRACSENGEQRRQWTHKPWLWPLLCIVRSALAVGYD
jgi:hypothetical protein